MGTDGRLVLGIETSCDETAAAVVAGGGEVLSNVVSSQVEVHAPYGGVVPEIASRHHLRNIMPVVEKAVAESRIDLKSIDALAVTRGPGLIIALLVGLNFAKALAMTLKVPLVPINHLEAHIKAASLDNPELEPPFVALIVSGGHTSLYHAPETGRYELLARCRDDAAGEAFDKVAKILRLGYPGGPIIDRLTAGKRVDSRLRFPTARMTDRSIDFSFSGLKASVKRYVDNNRVPPLSDGTDPAEREDIIEIIGAFQNAVVDSLVENTIEGAGRVGCSRLAVTGGVAANNLLRSAFRERCAALGLEVFYPRIAHSTDNAAMVAALGCDKIEEGLKDFLDLNAEPDLVL